MSGLPASLVELDLSSNLIDSTRGLATCTRLQRLRLAHNRIRRVEQVRASAQRAAHRSSWRGLRSRSSSR
jgi:Leucine-rich repeat (LRR) protein